MLETTLGGPLTALQHHIQRASSTTYLLLFFVMETSPISSLPLPEQLTTSPALSVALAFAVRQFTLRWQRQSQTLCAILRECSRQVACCFTADAVLLTS